MRGRPPKAAFDLALSSRASPRVTSRNSSSRTRMHSVLAICPGSTPCTWAASCTVAVESQVTRTSRSGARTARSSRTDCRLMVEINSSCWGWPRSKQAGQLGLIFEAGLFADGRRQRPAHEVARNVLETVLRHQLGHGDPLARERGDGDGHARFRFARADHPAIGAGPVGPVKALRPLRVAHSRRKGGAGGAVSGHLQHHLPDGEAVADGGGGAAGAGYGEVLAEQARRGRGGQFTRPPVIVFLKIDIDRLLAPAMVLAVENGVVL